MSKSKYIGLLSGLLVVTWGAGLAPAAVAPLSLVVIAHADTPALSEDTLKKIYEGKVVEVEGRSVIPVNLKPGSNLRKDFMEQILAQDDDRYIAYWTVRRFIGKGSPPREFASMAEQIEFIRTTPGAVGYIDANVEVKPGLKTIMPRR